MIVGIMQPYFLPYIGYFQLLNAVDKYVIYDNIQYTKKGWINRNRILQNGKDLMITIPVEKDSDYLDIKDRFVSNGFDKKKLLNQIRESYRKAPYFDDVMLLIENIINDEKNNLFLYVYNSVSKICKYLNINTEIIVSSTLDIDHLLKGQDKVIAICKELGATDYYNAIGGQELYYVGDFSKEEINLHFLSSNPIKYNQLKNEFVPWLSILDVMMFNSVTEIGEMLNDYKLISKQTKMKEIGGYFELQLRKGEHYHKGAVQLNTARNCLEYILQAKKYKKIYIPYLNSEVIWEPIKKLGIEHEFYSVDFKIDPIFDKELATDEVFFYSDIYGIKCNTVDKLVKRFRKQLIVDNTHAFYSQPYEGIDTIYSPRKFFGLPDGAYLYTDTLLNEELEQDSAIPHMTHLMKRIECESGNAGYQDFLNYCASLIDQPIRKMSNLADALLANIDYENLRERQISNFNYLHAALGRDNIYEFDNFPENTCPLSYMFYSEDPNLRKKLIDNKIYVSTYWKETLNLVEKGSAEYRIVNYLLPLPCDHRYDKEDMQRIVDVIGG